jgi:hypothetical protein
MQDERMRELNKQVLYLHRRRALIFERLNRSQAAPHDSADRTGREAARTCGAGLKTCEGRPVDRLKVCASKDAVSDCFARDVNQFIFLETAYLALSLRRQKKYAPSQLTIQPKPIAQPIIAIPTTIIQSRTRSLRTFMAGDRRQLAARLRA